MDILSLLNQLPNTLVLAAILSLAVLGFGFSLRILAYADLSLEGSFVLGAVVGGIAVSQGVHPLWVIPCACVSGALSGLLTAVQHCFLKVNKLLSGIISFAILYSINLRILGVPNLSLFDKTGLFQLFSSSPIAANLICGIVIICAFLVVSRLLHSELGLFMRAYGENPSMVSRAGYSQTPLILVGMAFSNALVALSGALFSQYSGYVDIGMGSGMLITCLTSLVLGEILVRPRTIPGFLVAILLGSIICQLLQVICLQLNLRPTDYKGILGLGLILLVFLRKWMLRKGGDAGFGVDVF